MVLSVLICPSFLVRIFTCFDGKKNEQMKYVKKTTMLEHRRCISTQLNLDKPASDPQDISVSPVRMISRVRASDKAGEDSAECLRFWTARQGRAGLAGGLATQRRRRFKISESSLASPSTALRREDENAKREEIPQNQAPIEDGVVGWGGH